MKIHSRLLEIEANLQKIFDVFDEYPRGLIPKVDKPKIMRYLNDMMDETDTKSIESAWQILEEGVSEIVVFEENESRVRLPGAKLGSFYLYHLDKADGEEEHINEEEGRIINSQHESEIYSRWRDRSLSDMDVAEQGILRTVGVPALPFLLKK